MEAFGRFLALASTSSILYMGLRVSRGSKNWSKIAKIVFFDIKSAINQKRKKVWNFLENSKLYPIKTTLFTENSGV